MIYRIYIEKRDRSIDNDKLCSNIKSVLGFAPTEARQLLRYDIEGLSEKEMQAAYPIFCEAPVNDMTFSLENVEGYDSFIVEYLDGQFDQRADSAMQCVQLLTGGVRPLIRCATVYLFKGLSAEQLAAVKKHLINPVDSKEGVSEMPETLERKTAVPGKMRVDVEGFIDFTEEELKDFYKANGFAMSFEDLAFVRDYFKKCGRQPTETELRVIDTYWSDHCRHTTFLTKLNSIEINSVNPDICPFKHKKCRPTTPLPEQKSATISPAFARAKRESKMLSEVNLYSVLFCTIFLS